MMNGVDLVFPEQAVGQAPIDTRPRGFDEVPPRALVTGDHNGGCQRMV